METSYRDSFNTQRFNASRTVHADDSFQKDILDFQNKFNVEVRLTLYPLILLATHDLERYLSELIAPVCKAEFLAMLKNTVHFQLNSFSCMHLPKMHYQRATPSHKACSNLSATRFHIDSSHSSWSLIHPEQSIRTSTSSSLEWPFIRRDAKPFIRSHRSSDTPLEAHASRKPNEKPLLAPVD